MSRPGPRRVAVPGVSTVGLTVLSIDHKRADTQMREQVSMDETGISRFLSKCCESAGFVSGVVLSTCNRTELYLEVSDPEAFGPAVGAALRAAGLEPALFTGPHVHSATGQDAITHLFRVACGLESLMVGEAQIVSQVKAAIATAAEVQPLSPTQHRAFRGALRASKQVRSKTHIGQGAVSVAFATVELARKFFDDLGNHHALVVGAGDTAALTARHFASAGIGGITIVNRSVERAEALAHDLRENTTATVDAQSLKELPAAMARADVVVSSTGAREPVIVPAMVRQAMRQRRGAPLFLLDIAVPRDIHPDVERLSDVYRYGMEDLDDIVKANLLTRRRDIPKAEEIIDHEVRQFMRWQDNLVVNPTLRDLRNLLDRLRNEEMQRYRGKVSTDVEHDIDRALESMARRVLHRPATLLRQEGSDRASDISALRRLFDLDESGDR